LAAPQGSTPVGLPPRAITTAYGFPTTGGTGQTIAIIDAYDDPTVAANLTAFSSQYSLPACTATNGCFTKVSQTGGTHYPSFTSGWSLEISLDVEWAHALAPKAHVLLVEASSSSYTNLFAAITYGEEHAQYVSMSWGGTEYRGETSFDSDFAAAPNVSFFASSGDTAKAVEYPAASPDVISVGGTTLTLTKSTYTWKGESAWSTAGGGCSAYEKPTAAQKAFPTYDQSGANCNGTRAIPDVALDGNPNSGVSVYDTKALSTGQVGWLQVGGTSASTVLWAARSAVAGVHVTSTYVYGTNIPFYDVTSGTNGQTCEKGYDLCTGLGSWNQTSGSLNAALGFGSAPQTTAAGSPSAAMTVTLSEPGPSVGLPVSLTTNSSTGGFSTTSTGPFSHSLSVTIPSGSTSSPSFYYQDTKAGSPVLTASASYVSSVTQTQTVRAGSLARITVSLSAATLLEGASQSIVASGFDQYTNQITAGFAPTWSTTAGGGTFVPAKGATTTFTAPTSPVSGTLSASQTGQQATIPLTVKVMSQPAALVNSKTWMNVFSVDQNGNLLNRWWQANSGWHDQVLATGAVGSPSAVLNGPTWMDVFYASTSGNLMNAWWQASSGWHVQALASGIVGSPVAVVRASTSMNVFYQGSNGTLMEATWQSTTGWQEQQVETGIAGTPTAVANSPTWMNVFYRNATGHLVNAWWQTKSGWHVQSLFSGDTGTPTAVVNSQTWMNVFYLGATSELMNAWWSGTSGWHVQALDSGAAGTPTAIVNSSTWMDTFYQSTSGNLMNAWWTSTSGWHDQSIASGSAGPPAAVLNAPTWMDVFDPSSTGGMTNAWWGSNSGWHLQTLP
jgi:hypothetical protein